MRLPFTLFSLILVIVLTGCSSEEEEGRNYITTEEGVQAYLEEAGQQLYTDLNSVTESPDSARVVEVYTGFICECYSKVDIERLHEGWLELEQANQEKGYNDLTALGEFARSHPELALRKECAEMDESLLKGFSQFVSAGTLKAALEESCGDHSRKHYAYVAMTDSMAVVNKGLEMQGEVMSREEMEKRMDEQFRELEESGQMTDELREKKALYESMKENR